MNKRKQYQDRNRSSSKTFGERKSNPLHRDILAGIFSPSNVLNIE